MICPILSQSTKDTEGNVVWDHHECIETSCSFWSEDASDCALRASGLLVIARAKASLTAGNGSGPQPGEPLFAPPPASVDEESLAPMREAIDESAAAMRDTGIKLLEGVVALEEPIKTGSRELGQRFDALQEVVSGIGDSLSGGFARIEEGFDKIRRAVEEPPKDERPEWLDPLEDSLASMSRQLESFGGSLKNLTGEFEEGLKKRPEFLDPLEDSLTSMSRQLETFDGKLSACAEDFGKGQRERFDAFDTSLKSLLDRVEVWQKEPEFASTLENSVKNLDSKVESLAEHLKAVGEHVDNMRGHHDSISEALSEEARRRKEDDHRRRREDAQAMNARGVALFYRGATDAAEATFRSAIDLNPDFAEAHNNLGLALSKQDKNDEAEASFKKTIELDPEMAEALNNLGFLFHQGMEFEKAVDMFRRAALGSNDSSMAWTNLGNACYKLGRYGEAVDAWKKGIEANPLNEGAKRALEMFQQEHSEQAGQL